MRPASQSSHPTVPRLVHALLRRLKARRHRQSATAGRALDRIRVAAGPRTLPLERFLQLVVDAVRRPQRRHLVHCELVADTDHHGVYPHRRRQPSHHHWQPQGRPDLSACHSVEGGESGRAAVELRRPVLEQWHERWRVGCSVKCSFESPLKEVSKRGSYRRHRRSNIVRRSNGHRTARLPCAQETKTGTESRTCRRFSKEGRCEHERIGVVSAAARQCCVRDGHAEVADGIGDDAGRGGIVGVGFISAALR